MGVRRLVFTIVGIALLVTLITPATVLADDLDSAHYRVRTVTLADGTSIDEVIINGPPTPPLGYERATAEVPEPNPEAGLTVLSDVPAFDWSFGCSATSAAMMAGYYDRTGYANMYAGPTNGGVMPLGNSVWPDWFDGTTWRHQCPLSATHNGLDGRATKGHVDDYWIYYGQPGPDPWVGNWQEHTLGDCTGDFMTTNQWVWDTGDPETSFNYDGSTVFYNYGDGSPVYDYQLAGWGVPYTYDGGYGLKLFYESRGYTVTTMYNQHIKGQGSDPNLGFTYDQYKAEIDAGRPVMIHLKGHTVVGVGYDDSSSDLMYIHDTWDHTTHIMTWGGIYSGMQHRGVTIVQLKALPVINSCDSGGTEKTFFQPDDNVSVEGGQFDLDTAYKIWIQDNPVSSGAAINESEDPSTVKGDLVITDINGSLDTIEIWAIPNEPFAHHDYDIVVDRQNDGDNTGKYNVASDGKVSIHVGMGGDVGPYPNGNGFVDIGDVILLLNHVGYPGDPTYALGSEWAGDCRCDDEINMGDVILLLNHVGYPGDPTYALDNCD
jgi:hypothetical protein